MEDDDLRNATASDRLTLDDEYAMQRSWRNDDDKLTFIICLPLSQGASIESVRAGKEDSTDRMIGDINLFLYDNEEDQVSDEAGLVGEIELMIARKHLRGQGYGRAALTSFLDYIISNWQSISTEFVDGDPKTSKVAFGPSLLYLRVKINEANQTSIRLFQSVGFVQVHEKANYFGEVELRWEQSLDYLRQLERFDTPLRLSYG